VARVFSGIQPSGDLHLGNYLGALRRFVVDQDEHESFFCIVDLHALTLPKDPAELRARTLSTGALYLAAGLDPARSTLFVQSHVHEHAELAWLMACTASFGELRRMTQFKDKSADQEFVSAGLFTYPVLMAGDILLYQTDIVPVGDDQRQHVELTRDIAERFNSRYGETFTVPKGVYPKEGARIKNLQEPERLMSTSAGNPQGVVRIVDEPDVIRKKFKTAVTDSGREVRHDPETKPGISNLIEIMSVVAGESAAAVEARYDGSGYGQFKEDVGEAVVALFAPIQERYRELRADEDGLRRLLAAGAEKAREVSAPTLEAMYQRMGFVRLGG
jgi:tryptophanyl-tRNA synthetase